MRAQGGDKKAGKARETGMSPRPAGGYGADILALQCAAGNQAVNRMLQEKAGPGRVIARMAKITPVTPANVGNPNAGGWTQSTTTYGGLDATSGTATSMRANLVSGKLNKGSATTDSPYPAWWQTLRKPTSDPRKKVIQKWFSKYMVRGHLLNEHLGGPGTDQENLAPITQGANSQHKNNAEKELKNAIKAGFNAEYYVKAHYSAHPASTDMRMAPGSALATDFDKDYAKYLPGNIETQYLLYDPATNKALTRATTKNGVIYPHIAGNIITNDNKK